MTARAGQRPAPRHVAGSVPALGSRPFRLLAGGQFVSNAGDGIYAVALPWYVLSHHGGAILLGTVLAAYGIPRTGLIMVGGHLSDRLNPCFGLRLAAEPSAQSVSPGRAAVEPSQ